MYALKHWHPVLLSKELGDEPRAVKVWDQEMVVFRSHGAIAALEDRCPHRFMRLSKGTVEDGCVVCPYHLWKYDGQGHGESACNPKMKPRAQAFVAAEHNGAIWVKHPESRASLPRFETPNLNYVCTERSLINAPFELVTDNFIEIEHSQTNHFIFAFDRAGITKVTPFYEVNGDSIHVNYTGPQRTTPWWAGSELLRIKNGSRLVIDFQVRFDPVLFIYDLMWQDAVTGKSLHHIREFAYLTPLSAKQTDVTLFFYSSLGLFHWANPVRLLLKPIFERLSHYEFLLDKRIVEGVASVDPRTDLKGMQLGVFDRVLRETRKLIQSVYHGGTFGEAPRSEVAGSSLGEPSTEAAPVLVSLPSRHSGIDRN